MFWLWGVYINISIIVKSVVWLDYSLSFIRERSLPLSKDLSFHLQFWFDRGFTGSCCVESHSASSHTHPHQHVVSVCPSAATFCPAIDYSIWFFSFNGFVASFIGMRKINYFALSWWMFCINKIVYFILQSLLMYVPWIL